MRARRSNHLRRGFSLVEALVASALAVFVSAAAFAFTQTQTRQVGLAGESLTMTHASRSMIELLREDLRHAGLGVGYRSDATFAGLLLGAFNVNGVAFNSNNAVINLESESAMPTDDVGMVMADGGYATISAFSLAGNGEICAGAGIQTGDLVVLRSEDGMAAQSAIVSILGSTPCSTGFCVGGCQAFTYATDGSFQSDSFAATASYLGGEMAGALKTIVWFVEASDPSRAGIGALRRATFDNRRTCTARDQSCGDLMAEDVETMQLQIWAWDALAANWRNISGGPLPSGLRLRVDLELVVRSRVHSDRQYAGTALRLEPGACVPACGTTDDVERQVMRASAEIKNSGRMRLR